MKDSSCAGCGRTFSGLSKENELCSHCNKFIKEKGLSKEDYLKFMKVIGDTMDDCQLCGKTKSDSGYAVLYFGLPRRPGEQNHVHHVHLCENCLKVIYKQWKHF